MINETNNYLGTYVIYTRLGCPYCILAKDALELRGLPYEEVNADTSKYYTDNFALKGNRKVPQIFKGDLHIGGCNQLMDLLIKITPMENTE